MTTATNNPGPQDPADLLATLRITKTTARAVGGTWVSGTIAGHSFEALVFTGHAASPDYEMGDSRISKFFLEDKDGCVACFDRGWDLRPTTAIAAQITDLLAAGLAEAVVG